MIKLAMAIIITSMPNWESVRYQGFLYPDMQSCYTYTQLYFKKYKKIAKENGDDLAHLNSICFEVDSYPIKKFNSMIQGT